MITLELPFPPSVNTYWGTRVVNFGKGKKIQRYVNEAGRKFRMSVIEYVMVNRIKARYRGAIACTVDLYPPCNRRRDCDNFNKGLLDAMAQAGIYDDDSQIIDLHIKMHAKVPGGKCVVTLQELG